MRPLMDAYASTKKDLKDLLAANFLGMATPLLDYDYIRASAGSVAFLIEEGKLRLRSDAKSSETLSASMSPLTAFLDVLAPTLLILTDQEFLSIALAESFSDADGVMGGIAHYYSFVQQRGAVMTKLRLANALHDLPFSTEPYVDLMNCLDMENGGPWKKMNRKGSRSLLQIIVKAQTLANQEPLIPFEQRGLLGQSLYGSALRHQRQAEDSSQFISAWRLGISNESPFTQTDAHQVTTTNLGNSASEDYSKPGILEPLHAHGVPSSGI